MNIKTKDKTITNFEEAKKFLKKYGLYAEFWEPESEDSDISDPLLKYRNQIEKLKKRFDYATADYCSLDKSNPKLDTILQPFMKEHHHTDDEVRFTVEGKGIFGINPISDPTFEICVEPGDLLVVPANTRHWFKLTEEKNICCIRIFKENPKWEAIYEMSNQAVSSKA